MSLLFRSSVCAACAALSACFPPGEGLEPPLDRIYFPVGVGLSADRDELYVANSDFDLQFNSGSLQVIDAAAVRELLPIACSSDADCSQRPGWICDVPDSDLSPEQRETTRANNGGVPSYTCVPPGESPCFPLAERSVRDRATSPGRCESMQLGALPSWQDPASTRAGLIDSVGIGAFATELLAVERPADAEPGAPERLFIPVRGDNTLHWVDVQADGTLDCGQTRGDNQCDDRHRAGDDPDRENTRDLSLPAEPFGVAISEDRSALVVTHQAEGRASLFVNSWNEGVGPTLQFVTGDMPARLVGVASLPVPQIARAVAQADDPSAEFAAFSGYAPGFLVTFRSAAEVRLLRFFDDQRSDPPRPFLQQAGTVNISANASNVDSRGIAVDASERQACESACQPGVNACLAACAAVPVGIYVANRSPASLLVGRTSLTESGTRLEELPLFYDSVPLPFGPSRVVIGQVRNEAGELETRVFVLCFDAGRIIIYDPGRRREETWIEAGRGPHAMVVDSQNGLAYVAHFTDSYLGIVDLDRRHPAQYAKIIGSIGTPTSPRASK